MDSRWGRVTRASLSLLVIVTAACGSAAPSPTEAPSAARHPSISAPPAASAPPAIVASHSAPSEAITIIDGAPVACQIGTVWAGNSGEAPLPRQSPCRSPVGTSDYRKVDSGGSVVTDPCGEAVLDTGCGRLYVFEDSTLTFSKCERHVSATGSVCLADGTIGIAEHCNPAPVIPTTPSASMRLEGTWASVTYQPESGLSLFVVLQGSADVTPFVDASGQVALDPIHVRERQFLFSQLGAGAGEVAGLQGRTAYDLSELPPVLVELGLGSTFGSVMAQADIDGVDLSGLPTREMILIRGQGGPLADPRVADAVLAAMDWKRTATQAFGDADRRFSALIGSTTPLDVSGQGGDLERGRALLDEAGVTGFEIRLITEENDRLLLAARSLQETLDVLGLKAFVESVDPGTGAAAYDLAAESGDPTIWLTEVAGL